MGCNVAVYRMPPKGPQHHLNHSLGLNGLHAGLNPLTALLADGALTY